MGIARRNRLALLAIGITVLGTSAEAQDGTFHPRGGDTDVPAFHVACRFSHHLSDDPIVFPNVPGASHPHDFFGNRSTNAFSTAEKLEAGAATTCNVLEDLSAYWTPSVYLDGVRVPAGRITAYYYAKIAEPSWIIPFPFGLKMIADGSYTWTCTGPGYYFTPVNRRVAPTCPAGMHPVLRLPFPECWDGRRLDSHDHRSHMAQARDGYCPPSHPVPLPTLVMAVHYRTGGGQLVLGPPGHHSSPHADFFAAWEAQALQRVIDGCLKTGMRCRPDDTRAIAAGEPPEDDTCEPPKSH